MEWAEINTQRNGTSANKITLASYGTGNMPVITAPVDDADADLSPNIAPDARTSIQVGIKLKNYVGWAIKGIEISDAEYGIIAYNTTQSPLSKVSVEDCYIHDISGGRMFTRDDDPIPILIKSDGIFIYGFSATVKNCDIQHTTRAIKLQIGFDFLIDDCYVYDSYTEGISITSQMRGRLVDSEIQKTGYPRGVFHGVAAVMLGSCNDVSVEDCSIHDVYDPGNDGVGIDYEGSNTNTTALRCNIYDCDSSAFLIYNTGTPLNDNSVSRIIDCRIDNCGRKDTDTVPVFIRHYGNANNNGVIIGNNIRIANANQKINFINTTNPQLTNNYPNTYSVYHNTVYSPGQDFPSVQSVGAGSWTASSSFSSTKGSGQWYYQTYNGTSYSDMIWDSANNRWKGDTTYSLVGLNWQHPDTNRDSVRKWIAPEAGTISITGVAKKSVANGDGVSVCIKKNNAVIFGPSVVEWNDTTGIDTDVSSINVDAGDAILFIVNKRDTITSDATLWDPEITMTAQNAWTSSDGFADGQGRAQWFYDYVAISDPGVYKAMSWDSANNRWNGNETYLIVAQNNQHPEAVSNSVRKWIAPRDGTITITGTAKKVNR